MTILEACTWDFIYVYIYIRMYIYTYIYELSNWDV